VDLGPGFNNATVLLAIQADRRIIATGDIAVGQTPELGLLRFLTDNPITDNNQRFVTHVYLDLLERSPDGGGLTTFTTALNNSQLSRMQVVQAITNSVEYHTLEVQGLYGRLLGRSADPAGLTNWVNFLNQGGTEEQLEAILIGSGEYFINRGAGTPSGFLQSVYSDVLRRPIDPGGAQTWGQAFTNGTTRTAVAAAILASRESDQIEVQDLYALVLHRAADTSGLNTFANALQQGMTNELVLAILASSDEYFSRP
jgi:hypothetical protein